MNEGYKCTQCGRTWYAADCLAGRCTPPDVTYKRYHTNLSDKVWASTLSKKR